jgi:hypothetical protein
MTLKFENFIKRLNEFGKKSNPGKEYNELIDKVYVTAY